MGFFFDDSEPSKGTKKRHEIPLNTARELGCAVCPLLKLGNFTKQMPPSGAEHPEIYIMGEGPGCISGDSLIQTAFRDKSLYPQGVPIKDLVGQKDFHVYSYDVESESVVIGLVKKVWKTGRKMTYKVTYQWRLRSRGKYEDLEGSIEVTENHPFLLRNPFIEHDPYKGLQRSRRYISLSEGLSIDDSIQPFHSNIFSGRSYIGSAGFLYNEASFLLAYKIGRPIEGNHKENCHHKDENPLNDSWGNLACLSVQEHARHHTTKNNSMHNPVHRETHKRAVTNPNYKKGQSEKQKEFLSDSTNYSNRVSKILETNESRSKTVKERWQDPEYRKKQDKADRSSKMKDLWSSRWNSPERRAVAKAAARKRSSDPKSYFNYLKGQQKRWGWAQEEFEQRFFKRFPDETLPPNNHKIISIEPIGVQDVYDMEVENYHNFAVNGIFVHNSEEDKRGIQFIGKTGSYLREQFNETRIKKIRFNNVVRDRPEGNREPYVVEIECCRKLNENDISQSKPKVIVPVGGVALEWVFQGTLTKPSMANWRKRFFPAKIGDHTCWVYPIYHPSYIMRLRRNSKKGEEIKTEWDRLFESDIKHLLTVLESDTLGTPYIESEDEYLGGIQTSEGGGRTDLEKVLGWLEQLKNEKYIGLDIETNVLRPYSENARILTISIGTDKKTFAFPIDYIGSWREELKKELKQVLKGFILNGPSKICHNVKFEQEWIAYFFGQECLDARWEDTMGQAYCLDERKGMLKLDVLIRINFGFWLKKISNLDRKNMEQYPLYKILPYNALDTKYTYKLFFKQQEKLNHEPSLKRVYKSLMKACPTLVYAQMVGLCVDLKEQRKQLEEADTTLAEVDKKIRQLDSVQTYESRYGSFNIDSPQQVLTILKDICGYTKELEKKSDDENGRRTENKSSTDNTVLEGLKDEPLAKLVLEHRAISKKKSTYIEPLTTHLFPDGRIHTKFNPFETTTGRLSSDSPNVQNFPNRKGKEVRKMIIPPPDHWMICADYGQIEGRLIAVASQDEFYCKAIWDDYDVHMVWAKKIAEAYPPRIGGEKYLEDVKILNKFRKDVKNQWTFPAFYGSADFNIARALGVPYDIVKVLFKEFWKTFEGVKRWQRWIEEFYNKHGYVETLTGRRRHGPMSMNMAINMPIQGTASDICVDAMGKLREAGIKIVLNVHDDDTSYVPITKDEEEISTIARIMCTPNYKWLNVPLSVELSAGANWCDQTLLGTYKSTDYIDVARKMYKIGHYREMQ